MFFPDPQKSVLAVIDMQERLLPAMAHPESCTERTALLIRGAAALKMPMIVSEQYPKGLGPTVPAVASLLPEGTDVFAKGAFSCFGEEAWAAGLAAHQAETLILCGVEAHVCVAQTAWDARKAGMEVFVIRDAVSSRRDTDRDCALEQLRADGVRVVTAEMMLFLLLRTSGHPAFREISKLVK